MAPQIFQNALVTVCGFIEVGENAARNAWSLLPHRKTQRPVEHDPARGKTVLITGQFPTAVTHDDMYLGAANFAASMPQPLAIC